MATMTRIISRRLVSSKRLNSRFDLSTILPDETFTEPLVHGKVLRFRQEIEHVLAEPCLLGYTNEPQSPGETFILPVVHGKVLRLGQLSEKIDDVSSFGFQHYSRSHNL